MVCRMGILFFTHMEERWELPYIVLIAQFSKTLCQSCSHLACSLNFCLSQYVKHNLTCNKAKIDDAFEYQLQVFKWTL